MSGVMRVPNVSGRSRPLVYIQRARVAPEYQGKRIGWYLANDLFTWSRDLGAEGHTTSLRLTTSGRSRSEDGRAAAGLQTRGS
jgi:hypothetical protein